MVSDSISGPDFYPAPFHLRACSACGMNVSTVVVMDIYMYMYIQQYKRTFYVGVLYVLCSFSIFLYIFLLSLACSELHWALANHTHLRYVLLAVWEIWKCAAVPAVAHTLCSVFFFSYFPNFFFSSAVCEIFLLLLPILVWMVDVTKWLYFPDSFVSCCAEWVRLLPLLPISILNQ